MRERTPASLACGVRGAKRLLVSLGQPNPTGNGRWDFLKRGIHGQRSRRCVACPMPSWRKVSLPPWQGRGGSIALGWLVPARCRERQGNKGWFRRSGGKLPRGLTKPVGTTLSEQHCRKWADNKPYFRGYGPGWGAQRVDLWDRINNLCELWHALCGVGQCGDRLCGDRLCGDNCAGDA